MKELKIPYVDVRSQVPENSLVIGRYSVVPFYQELEKDLQSKNSRLINNYNQFRYCADIANWYRDLQSMTPRTWFSLQEYLASDYNLPVVLKGETNSRRDKWFTHMYAANKDEARDVYQRLMDDSLVSQQQIYIRAYMPLKTYIEGVNGMPIPNEWRVFVLFGEVVACDYYWGTYLEDILEKGIKPTPPPQNFIKEVIARVGANSNFYTIDIAQVSEQFDIWTVIELNEGQMSGLNLTDPLKFYKKLKEVMDEK